jgi:hypothetical protein
MRAKNNKRKQKSDLRKEEETGFQPRLRGLPE